MRSIPGMIVTAPKDGNEMFNLIHLAIENKLMLSMRYPKENTLFDLSICSKEKIILGTWEVLLKGSKICILTFGSMISNSIKAANLNNDNVTVVNCRFIKPIDEELLSKLILEHDYFITIEEGVISGGFGSSILEYFSNNNVQKMIKIMGIQDEFTTHGDRNSLLKICKLDVKSIDIIIKNYLNEQ